MAIVDDDSPCNLPTILCCEVLGLVIEICELTMDASHALVVWTVFAEKCQ